MRILLALISLMAPRSERPRWREEWRAELQHGGWRMLAGALPDAWAMRRVRRALTAGSSRSHPLHAIGQDFRYALRGLSSSPGFVAGVVLSLSVGMTAMTAAFSLVNAIVFRPPGGIGQPDELAEVRLTQMRNGFPYNAATRDRYRLLMTSTRSFSGIAGQRGSEAVVAFPGEPVTVPAMFVSVNYFEVLRVTPALGRLLGPAHEQEAVAVISHDAWRQYFGRDTSVVGRTLKVNGQPLEVVGVAPAEFTGVRRELDDDDAPRVWLPLPLLQVMMPQDITGTAPSDVAVGLVGRLRPGVDRVRAQAETTVLAAAFPRADRPDAPIQSKLVGLGGARPDDGTTLELLGFLTAFMAVPAIVLALACVNAANLLASRASRRLREAAVRLSMGATPWRVVRLLLVESMLLAAGGCVLGLAFTYWAAQVFGRYTAVAIHIDWRVALFAAGLSALTAVSFGLAPALAATARAGDLVRGMARRPATRARRVLIATQAALSLALMLTGWQFANTVRSLAQNDGLRDADHLVLGLVDVSRLNWSSAEIEGYYDRIFSRINQLEGVSHASYSCQCNPWGAWQSRGGGSAYIWLGHHPPEKPGSTLAMYAGGDLFGAFGLPIIAGRNFNAEDHRSPVRSVIVNQPFAEKYLSGHAIGQSMRLSATRDFGASHPAVVVGVVAAPTARRTDSHPQLYYPAPLETMPARALYVRFTRPAADMIGPLHTIVREAHPDAPRPQIATAEHQRWERHKSNQFLAAAVSLLGLLALLLVAGGLYGVVAFVVTLRSQEIAVRMALGAQPSEVVRMVVRQAMAPAVVGAAVGVLGAVVTGLVVRARLYGSAALDPVALAGAVSVLFVVLLAATITPALRAARINPVDTLRTE